MILDTLFKRFYHDPKYEGTATFFSTIRSAVRPSMRVLNLGAGPATNNWLCILKGEVAEVVGADIDPVVLSNKELDSAVVIVNDKLPFADQSFDLAFSDYVMEHVERPVSFLSEVRRVLRPGASYFFRTPNVYHYVVVISRMTPHSVHTAFANKMRGLAEDAHEPWPTFYRMNSRRMIQRAAAKAGFSTIKLQMVEGPPSYLIFHALPFLAGVAYERFVNISGLFAPLRSNIFGQLVK